jgi:hypothetical protein
MVPRRAATLALLGSVMLPDRVIHDGPVLCPFRRLTGRPCPTCGLTRSWQAIGHGRLMDGIRQHPLGPLTMLGALWLALDERAERRLEPTIRRSSVAVAVGWVATWLWRVSRQP